MSDNKHHIENYRGHDIYYDEESEKFVCDISIEDRAKSTSRISLKTCRQEIDSFIKENLDFKPFKIMHFVTFDGDCDEREVVGVRSDGAMVVEREERDSKEKGKKRRDHIKEDSYDAKGVKKWNADFLAIEKEWKEHEAIWTKKKKELQEKVKNSEKSIDWKYIEQFKKKN